MELHLVQRREGNFQCRIIGPAEMLQHRAGLIVIGQRRLRDVAEDCFQGACRVQDDVQYVLEVAREMFD